MSIYDLEVEAYAINRGIDMARDKTALTRALRVPRYEFCILDNPYKNSTKKLSAAWHNAFYAECKKLGRRSR